MEIVKKSFNLPGDLAQRIDQLIRANPGISFTYVMTQALATWLKNPQLTLQNPNPVTDDDVTRFMDQNKALMDDLAK